MQRREGGRGFELRQDRVVDQAMLPELWAAMDNSMPDRVGRRHLESARSLPMRMIASRWLGMGRRLASNACPRESSRGIDRLASPIDSASPESSLSIRDGPTRYKPNLSEEEPLFSARHSTAARRRHALSGGNIALTRSSASRGLPACRRRAR